MLRIHAMTVGLGVALLGLASTGVFAQQGGDYPVSRGVVATITARDAKTSMATLQTEAGEVFELPKGWQWHVGHKVECDRIEKAPHPELQRCQSWESAHAAGDAATRREWQLSSR
jgi:hypothetical protein